MPFHDTFRLREPSRSPTLWLVPRLWAFSRDDRYRIGSAGDRNGSGRRHLSSRPAGASHGTMPLLRDVANRQIDRPDRGHDSFRNTGELPRPLNQAPAKSHTVSKGLVYEEPRSYDIRSPEAAQPYIPFHKATLYTRQTDHKSDPPAYEQARHHSTRQKKGQSTRCIRTSQLQRATRSTEHDPDRQHIELNHKNPVLQQSEIPTKAHFSQPVVATHQHEEPPSILSHSSCCGDEPLYLEGLTEQQKDLIQMILNRQRDQGHHPQLKHAIPVTKRFTEKALPTSPVPVAHYLDEPDLMKTSMIRFGPTTHTPTTHSCARPSSSPDHQELDPVYKDIDCGPESPAKRLECLLQKLYLAKSTRSPSDGYVFTSNQVQDFSSHPSRCSHVDHNWSQHSTSEQYECPHHARDDDCQHAHDDYHTRQMSWSPQTPNDHTARLDCNNIRQKQNHQREGQYNCPGREYELSCPSLNMPSSHDKMQINQSTGIHEYCQDHEDLSNHVDHRYLYSNDKICVTNSSQQPVHLYQTTDRPDPRRHDRHGQLYCSNRGSHQGRRMSYVRTRRNPSDNCAT